MRIKPENSIAIFVDYQAKLCPAMSNLEPLLHNSAILMNGLKALEVPTLISQQYTKGIGETVAEIMEPAGDTPVYEKLTFSCYQTEEIKKAIDESGRKTVIVCGIEAHVCVLQTVIDLREAGYQVVLVEDCIDSRKPSDKATGLKRAQYEGAIITSYEALLFELTQIAGTERFKKISKLVK